MRARVEYLLDRLAYWLVDALPKPVLNVLTLQNIGRLISADKRLHFRVVGDITVDEICSAVTGDESGFAHPMADKLSGPR